MDRTITVTGTGKVSVKPDLIVLTFGIESTDFDYEKTMELATKAITELTAAVESSGIEKDELKTTRFHIQTQYESIRDEQNNFQQRFAGYTCVQDVKLEFDFDTHLLDTVLSAVAESVVNPTLQVNFSVKDPEKVQADVLQAATQTARKKAAILTEAAGVTLGELISINYNWNAPPLFSPTEFHRESRMMMAKDSPEMNPDDIQVKENVTFIWEIKGA